MAINERLYFKKIYYRFSSVTYRPGNGKKRIFQKSTTLKCFNGHKHMPWEFYIDWNYRLSAQFICQCAAGTSIVYWYFLINALYPLVTYCIAMLIRASEQPKWVKRRKGRKKLPCAWVVCSYLFLGTRMYLGEIQFTTLQHCLFVYFYSVSN